MGIMGGKTSKKDDILLKKGDHPLLFQDLTLLAGPIR